MSHRILIFGSPGSGKSTLARTLGTLLQIEPIHIDDVFWLPGWVEMDKQQLVTEVLSLVEGKDSWIVDGNYSSVRPHLLEKATHAIVLRVLLLKNLWRVFWRTTIQETRIRPFRVSRQPLRVKDDPNPNPLWKVHWLFFKHIFMHYRWKTRQIYLEAKARGVPVLVTDGMGNDVKDFLGIKS